MFPMMLAVYWLQFEMNRQRLLITTECENWWNASGKVKPDWSLLGGKMTSVVEHEVGCPTSFLAVICLESNNTTKLIGNA